MLALSNSESPKEEFFQNVKNTNVEEEDFSDENMSSGTSSVKDKFYSDLQHFEKRVSHGTDTNNLLSTVWRSDRSKSSHNNRQFITFNEEHLGNNGIFLETNNVASPKDTDTVRKPCVRESLPISDSNTAADGHYLEGTGDIFNQPHSPITQRYCDQHEISHVECKNEVHLEWRLKDIMDEFDENYPDEDNEFGMEESFKSMVAVPSSLSLYQSMEDFANANNFEVRNCASNGNCMFQAVNDQLQINGEFSFTARSLRQKAMDYLRENPTDVDGNRLECFISKDESWEDYLSRMSLDSQWGDHVTLQAMVNVVERTIVVINIGLKGAISKHELLPTSRQNIDEKDVLFLGHLGEFHYLSLRPKDWTKRWPIKAKQRKNATETPVNYDKDFQEIYDSQSYLRLDSHYIDPVSGVPMPHLSFITTHLVEEEYLLPIVISKRLEFNKEYGDSFYLEKAGAKSDGTDVLIAPFEPKRKVRRCTESIECGVYSTLLVCKNKKVCDADVDSISRQILKTEEENTHPGYCRLRLGQYIQNVGYWHCPCKSCIEYVRGWETKDMLEAESKSNLLIEKVYPAFEFPEWPDAAKEWLSREPISEWPSSDLRSKIKNTGCYVIQRNHPYSQEPEIEWQFIFPWAEKLLFEFGLSETQKYVYKVLKALVDYSCKHLKTKLHTYHIKSVFYIACEELTQSQFDESIGGCLLYSIGLLLIFLKTENLPNYFIKENNMIDCIERQTLDEITASVETLRRFPLQSIMFAMDDNGHHRSWLIDLISKDFDRFKEDLDLNRSVCKIFFPATLRLMRKLTMQDDFFRAFLTVKRSQTELVMAPPDKNGKHVYVPDLKSLLQEVVTLCDEQTKSPFIREIEEQMEESLFQAMDSTKRVRDIMGEDVGGFGHSTIPEECVNDVIKEASYLNRLGCILHNNKGNYHDSAKFFSAAIDHIEMELESGFLDVGLIEDIRLRRQIFVQQHQTLQKSHSLLWTCYKNLCVAYTITMDIDKIRDKMPKMERLCWIINSQEVTEFVAHTWMLLGEPSKGFELQSQVFG